MPQVIIPRSFRKMLKVLSKSDRVGIQAAQRAEAACTQANLNDQIRLERTHNGESRLDCEKYELGDGYRLVLQRNKVGSEDFLIMLFVGSHTDSDTWLALHRGYKWVRKDSDGKIDFIQVSSPEEPRRSPHIDLSMDTPDHVLDEPLLSSFTADDFKGSTLGPEITQILLGVTKGDWGEASDSIITKIEEQADIETALLALDLLSLADHSDIEGARQRLLMDASQAHEASTAELLEAVNSPINAETFYTWKEEEGMPDPSDREEWMLYLHPDQRKIAHADLAGPSRLRGVSGSGKTCVLVHRAQFLANKYGEPVLVVTLTESMRKLLTSLVTALCGPERVLIHVATIQGLARDVVQDLNPNVNRRPVDSYADGAMAAVIKSVPEFSSGAHALGRLLPHDLKHFLREELSYIRTRLLPAQYSTYATSSFRRIGRGKALGETARKQVMHGLQAYEQYITESGAPDFEGMLQEAVTLLDTHGDKSSKRWRAVLADEVQDLSQNEIYMLSLIRTPAGELLKTAPDGLFLVGDGAQTIYKRGFSLKTLGINLYRASVFKKNYRNTKEILQAAYALIINYEFSDIDEDSQQKPLAPDFAVRRGERPGLVRCKTKADELDYVVSAITKIKDIHGEQALDDVCVISRSKWFRTQAIQAMQQLGIPCVDVKGNFSIDSPGVRVSTVESSKGFEFGTVFLANVSEAVSNARPQVATEAGDVAKLYVAMTRARDLLHISYVSNNESSPVEALHTIGPWCESLKFEDGNVRALVEYA